MQISKFRQRRKEEWKKKAYSLYKEGATLREVSTIMKTQYSANVSHEWVRKAVIELTGLDKE